MIGKYLSGLKKSKGEFLFLLFLLIVSFALRVWNLNHDLLFQHDQGMVAYEVYDIWHNKNISLIGPRSDVDGLVHSPIYYWLLAPVFALSGSEVWIPAAFQILLEILSLPFLYFAAKKLFDRKTAITSLVVYSVSYGLVSYSRWFITVPLALPLTNILLYSLAYKKGAFLSSLMVGIITQLDAAVGVFYFPFLLFHYRKEMNIKKIVAMFTGFLLPALPLIIFQFRHDFVTVKAVIFYILNKEAGVGLSLNVFWENLKLLFGEVRNIFLYPYNIVSAIIFSWALFLVSKTKNKVLVFSYLLIPYLFLSFFQRGAIRFFYISAIPLCLIVLAYAFSRLSKKVMYLGLGIVIILNVLLLRNIYEPNNALIPIGDENVITLQDRKNVIDWMYEKADGKSFSFWSYVLPYYQEYTWDYLFLTYAPQKYGYLPEKTKSFSRGDLTESELFFNLYEVDHAHLWKQDAWFEEIEKQFGGVVDSYRSHDQFVELREPLRP